MADPKLISMKRTEKDKREDAGEHAPMEAIAPDYPWGLCLHIDKDELDKLGITELPKAGATMTLTAKVTVTRVSQSASTSPKAYEQTSIDLQVTDMALL